MKGRIKMNDLVQKYSLGSDVGEILGNATKVYLKVLGGAPKSESQVAKESVLRNQLQADPTRVQVASNIAHNAYVSVVEHLEQSPLDAPAIYQAFVELTKRIKEIRDDNVTDAAMGTKRETKLDIPYADLEGLRRLIDTLFPTAAVMGQIPANYPTKTTSTGKATPDIPKLPSEGGRDTSTSQAIKSFLIWEVDGTVYRAISPRKLAREVLSTDKRPVTTGEIWEAFGHRDSLLDGTRHTTVINGKSVTCYNGSAGDAEEESEDSEDE